MKTHPPRGKKKMEKLNVMERMTALSVLPKEGNFALLKVLRDLQEKLSFTEDEHKEFEIKQENDQVKWNVKGNEPKEIEFGIKEQEMVKDELEKLDKDKKLEFRHFSLFEKFVVAKEEDKDGERQS